MATATFQHRGKDENPSREPNQPKDQNPTKESLEKAKDMGSQVVEKAKEIGSEVMDKTKEAFSSVGETVSHAASNLGQKADDLTASAGSNVRHLGDKIEQQGPHEGMLGQASHVVADTLRTSGKYIEEAKLSGMADDVTGMIRRNPMPAVLIGIGIGFLLGRALRA
jgi:ElaB/YqjD/DUF883 family membrane-anchored ribosome-binding protein